MNGEVWPAGQRLGLDAHAGRIAGKLLDQPALAERKVADDGCFGPIGMTRIVLLSVSHFSP